jgi:hypothetical protein
MAKYVSIRKGKSLACGLATEKNWSNASVRVFAFAFSTKAKSHPFYRPAREDHSVPSAAY